MKQFTKSIAMRLWRSATLMTWGSLAVRMSSAILVLPLVLRRFNAPEVAVWLLFYSIYSLVLVMDLGLAPTFMRYFSYARAGIPVEQMAEMRQAESVQWPVEHSRQNVARMYATLSWIYPRLAFLAVLLFVLGGTLALRKPISQSSYPTQMWLSWLVVLCGSYWGIQAQASTSALHGLDKVAVQRRAELFIGIGQILSCTVVLVAGGNLLALVCAYHIWNCVITVCNRKILSHYYPEMRKCKAKADETVLKALWPATWRSGLGVLMSYGIIQGSGLIYGQLVSAADLASYLLALRMITVISQVCQAPFYSKLPNLGLLYASSKKQELQHIAQRAMCLSLGILCVGSVVVAFGSDLIFYLIKSKTSFVSPTIWALLALAFFVERYGAMHLQLYSLTNHIVWHIANGVTGIVMIFVAVLMYKVFGLAGLPASMLLAYLTIYAPYSVYLSQNEYGFKFWTFEFRASLIPLSILSVALLVRIHH